MIKAAFWRPGTKLAGTITRHVNTQHGPIMELALDKPRVIKGDKKKNVKDRTISHVILGNQRGLQMAAESAGVPFPYPLQAHVDITCTGHQHTGKGNDMALFSVEFDVPDDMRQADVADVSDFELAELPE